MASRWPRDAYVRAVWESDLKALNRLVCLAYADHARKGDTAWLTLDRLADVTGMARSTAAARLSDVVDLGWLVLVEQGRQHRASRYRLVDPSNQQSGSRTPEAESSSPGADTSSPGAGTSSPGAGTDLQETTQETAAAPAAGVDLDAFVAKHSRAAS